MFSRRVIATTSVATLTALALSGCVSFIDVADSNGVGECSGKGSVSLSVTQNTPGDSISIDYQGPSDVELAAVQGFYSESKFYDQIPTRLLAFGINDSDNTATYINVLEPDSDWTSTTTAPGFVHAHYAGTVNDFVSQFSYSAGTIAGADPIMDRFVPFAVGVSCDSSLVSGVFTDFDPDNDYISTAVEFAVAQPVFPNHVVTDAMEVVTQAPTTAGDGIEGTVKFPAGTLARLGDFTPDLGLYVVAVPDLPEVPNNNMSDLWFQALLGETSSNNVFTINTPYSMTAPMPFTFVNSTDGVLTEGDYILFFQINGTDGDGNSAGKFLFAAAHYSEDGGLDVTDVEVPLSGDVQPTPPVSLADTGASADTLVLGGFAAAILVAGATMFVVRRRRA